MSSTTGRKLFSCLIFATSAMFLCAAGLILAAFLRVNQASRTITSVSVSQKTAVELPALEATEVIPPTTMASFTPGLPAQIVQATVVNTPLSSATNGPQPTATIYVLPTPTPGPLPTATLYVLPSPTPGSQPTAAMYVLPGLTLGLQPTATLYLLPSPTQAFPDTSLFACLPIGTERSQGRVVKVVDGDTIDVDIAGNVHRVRYIGMDTPETTFQKEAYGKEASEANKQLVMGKLVTLIKDVSETDKYGRLLRYVIVDNIFVNLELVNQGFATVSTYPPDVACQGTYLSAQSTARDLSLGLWGAAALLPSLKSGSNQPVPTSLPIGNGNCSPAYPGVCIPPAPPDLDCKDIPFRRFQVLPPDPHNFDRDGDGIGCES